MELTDTQLEEAKTLIVQKQKIKELLSENKNAEAVHLLCKEEGWEMRRAHEYIKKMELDMFGEEEVKRRHQIICTKCHSSNVEVVRKENPKFLYKFLFKLERHCLDCGKRW